MFFYKTILSVFILLFTVNFIVIGQNLVPNPSFEEYSECPSNSTPFETCFNWVNPNNYSPDYFNECDVSIGDLFGVPSNAYGSQYAHQGVAYAGIFIPADLGGDGREYVQVQLIDDLLSNELYFVEYYVSLSENSEYAIHSLGAYLSQIALYHPTSSFYFDVEPQILNSGNTNPLSDKLNWIKVSGSFIATGGERYITIGNFESSEDVDLEFVEGGIETGECLYYIDDVYVGTENPNSINDEMINDSWLLNNVTNGLIYITQGNQNVETNFSIFNSLGQIVLSNKLINNQIDTSELSQGLYILNLYNGEKLLKTERIVKL